MLDSPRASRLAEQCLAPGAEAALAARLIGWLGAVGGGGWILDVGCGPSSRVATAGCPRVIATDLSLPRAAAVQRNAAAAIVATAAKLPFADAQFDAVWCGGVLHHLADPMARAVVHEIMRVTRPSGHCVIFDSVLPEPAWRRPLAWAVRRLDRGRFVRTQAAFETLLSERYAWRCERFTYARNGLEGVWCSYIRTAVSHPPVAAART